MSRLGFAQGGVVPHYVGHEERAEQRQQAGQPDPYANAAGAVVDSLPYAAAQFVPGLNVPLGAAAASVHAAQGRFDELPLDAASMVPGGKGVLLAKGAKLAAKRAAGGLGRAANSVQALGAADAFGAPAYAQGGTVVADGGRSKGPTADSVPVNLSHGEAVLPVKTVAALGGPAAVEHMIEATNGRPTATGGLRAGGNYSGGYVDDFGNITNQVPNTPSQRHVVGQQIASAITGDAPRGTLPSNATVEAGKAMAEMPTELRGMSAEQLSALSESLDKPKHEMQRRLAGTRPTPEAAAINGVQDFGPRPAPTPTKIAPEVTVRNPAAAPVMAAQERLINQGHPVADMVRPNQQPVAPANMAPDLEFSTPSAQPAATPTERPGLIRRGINTLAEKVGYRPVAPAAPAGGAAPIAEAPSTPISAKTQAALRANMAGQSLYGRTVEAFGNAKQSLERGAARVAASPYARELGRAATIVAAAGPAIENSLGENRIKPVGERTLGTDAAAGVLNSVDAGAKFIDNTASPITHGLNYAVKTFGGPENYFNDRALSNAVRRGIASTGEFTAPTTQNGEKVKIAGASSAPAQPAAIEPGAQERTFGASGAAPAPTSAAVADTEKPANDIQVRSIRGANGKMQPEFYGTNVTQTYMGADGKPTTNWYETQAYKDSQVQAAKDKELLKTYEKWGLEGDLKSNNPAYQARGLARQKVFNENAQTDLARTQSMNDRDFKRQGLEIQREDLELRRAQEQRAIAAASRQAQLAATEEGRKADEATSKKQSDYHKYLESVLTMPLTDSNGNVTNAPDARAIGEFTSKADATVAAMEEATRNTAEHSRWIDPTTKKPKSVADLDDTQKSWILNRFKAYQRVKQAQKGWATLGYADKFDTNDLSLLDGAEEGDYISFPKLKAKLGFVPRIQKKDLAYSDGPIGLTDLQLGKTPYDALTNNILGR